MSESDKRCERLRRCLAIAFDLVALKQDRAVAESKDETPPSWPNAEALAMAWGVSKRTIYRDLKRLNDAGFVVEYDEQANGYAFRGFNRDNKQTAAADQKDDRGESGRSSPVPAESENASG